MTATGTEDFETGAAQGAALSTSSTWFATVPAATVMCYDATVPAAVAKGSWCCKVMGAGGTDYAQRTFPATTGLLFWRQYLTVATRPSGATGITNVMSGSTVRAGLQLLSTGQLRIRNQTTTAATTVAALTNGTRYRVEWRLDLAASQQELRLYVGDSTTPVETITGLFNTGTMLAIRPGVHVADAGIVYRIDSLATDDATWLGPVPPGPPAGPTVKVWTGVAEVTGTVTVWNGSTEVAIGSIAVN